MYRLVNPIKGYSWGSRSAIAELLGQPAPADEPQAEMWMGAYPSAPSMLMHGGTEQSLAAAVEESPRELLGEATLARFGARLPFLLKVLAVEQPLSLQVHPSGEHASRGFAAEQRNGVPLDSPKRTYRDASHKPELICALTPFEALCGLRPVAEIVDVLEELAVPQLDFAVAALARNGEPDGIRALLMGIFTAADPVRLVAAVHGACSSLTGSDGRFAASFRLTADLAQRFPGDPGVVVSLLLNLLRLRPGEATYVPPGRLHSYLGGVGIEIMASSDNVLRGGLTTKNLDVAELMSVLEPRSAVPEIIDCLPDGSGWCTYATPAVDFALSRVILAGDRVGADLSGPQILLCVDGALSLTNADGKHAVSRGQSVFVPAGERVALSGTGTAFRAATG